MDARAVRVVFEKDSQQVEGSLIAIDSAGERGYLQADILIVAVQFGGMGNGLESGGEIACLLFPHAQIVGGTGMIRSALRVLLAVGQRGPGQSALRELGSGPPTNSERDQ